MQRSAGKKAGYSCHAQEWDGRWELTLLLGSSLGDGARAGQQSLVEVRRVSRVWRRKVSQEHGGSLSYRLHSEPEEGCLASTEGGEE